MSAPRSMSMVRYRVAALERASTRRERLELELRMALVQLSSERVALLAEADESARRLQDLEAVVLDHSARITRMMTAQEPFSGDAFSACCRYLEIIDTRKQEAQAALDAKSHLVLTKENELSAARREIALNRGRIEGSRKRLRELEGLIERAALDAEDEAAEELVLARRSRA